MEQWAGNGAVGGQWSSGRAMEQWAGNGAVGGQWSGVAFGKPCDKLKPGTYPELAQRARTALILQRRERDSLG